MSEIRRLSAEEIEAFAAIAVNAYPGWEVAPAGGDRAHAIKEQLLKILAEDPTKSMYGLFRDGRLLGGMLFHDFTMNCLGTWVLSGGVGLVAVDLPHKKEHVAKEMIAYFTRHYRERGSPITQLYPFRPDFYKQMGYGYGTKMSQYRLRPAALPQGPAKSHVRYLGEADQPALAACYNRFAAQTHGMFERSARDFTQRLRNPQVRFVGYERDGQIRGYIVFMFKEGESFIINDIHVREFVYEDPEALSELMTFLHTQADQIRHVIINTQDESFHHLLLDPRNGSPVLIPSVYHESNLQGVGLLYRLVNVPAMFQVLKERDFGGQTGRLTLTIADSFLPENAGSTLLHFDQGRLSLPADGPSDVEIRMDIAEFSSLLMGAVNFRSLHRYGLAHISDPAYVGVVDKVFAVADKPVCMTHF